MPHINDLSMNNIFEGNNGEKWQVTEEFGDDNKITKTLIKLKVVEELIKET